MKSQVAIKSHPLHPMLIPFPFAFLAGGWAFGVAGALFRKSDLSLVARYLIPTGVAAGVAAAVPGILDYSARVPPDSSAKSRAAKHGLLNGGALLLFTAGWLAARRGRRPALPLVLQGLGAAALSAGGWMGGTLVYRNQIGVDHRSAGAGRWEEHERQHAGPYALQSAAAGLGVNQLRLVRAGGKRIAVGRTEQGLAAFDDRCTHRGGPLSDGTMICGTVQCPWHGSQFDVATGEVRCGPATEPIATYEIGTPPAISGAGRRPRESSRRSRNRSQSG